MIPCPEWMEAFLEHIEAELDRVMWNKNQEEYDSPFRNTGNAFENETFLVCAYVWDWDATIAWDAPSARLVNFLWKPGGVAVSWYKGLGRGTEMNREVSPEEGIRMLDECVASLRRDDALTWEPISGMMVDSKKE